METGPLKRFSQEARRQLLSQVGARLDYILKGDSPLHREKAKVIEKLREEISGSSRDSVVERVAYLWFNRFIALRFMDVNRYTFTGIVSPREGNTLPELLMDAKQGMVPDELKGLVKKNEIDDILSGKVPSGDPQQQVYRILLVAACNYYHNVMPFIFEEIADYTELLIPEDLLSENSLLHEVREILTPETCTDVEIIGWLYQFYISEKKDQVFNGLKSNKKISPEDIPAATQLFTPHWIVRYLVENSLGRLWLLNRPNSLIIKTMDYYIKPVDEETDFLVINSPEEIKLCDPACGSGHMLTYAFDLLFQIYEEEGYDVRDIPRLILEKNLFGMEIDERAGELAAFALMMKAREKDRDFFIKSIRPNILVYNNVIFDDKELNQYIDEVGRDLFTEPLLTTLNQFREAKTFGSLIRPETTDVEGIKARLEEAKIGDNLLLHGTHQKVIKVLEQVQYLKPDYHIVVTNPPYMGSGGMDNRLKDYTQREYPISKFDYFAMFIELNIDLSLTKSYISMITMQSWMFLSSFEQLRENIIHESTLISMAHLGTRAFDSIGGEVVSTTAFVIQNVQNENYMGEYLRLVGGRCEEEKKQELCHCSLNSKGLLKEKFSPHPIIYKASAADFTKIPGAPIAYWVSEKLRALFNKFDSLRIYNKPLIGMRTGDNERFIRLWHEVSYIKCSYNSATDKKWYPYTKGGECRRWYGNNEYLVNWHDNGYEIKENTLKNYPNLDWDNLGWKISNEQYYFKESISWTCVSNSLFSARYNLPNSLFDTGGSFINFKDELDNFSLLGYLNTKITQVLLLLINPTINYGSGTIAKLPYNTLNVSNLIKKIVSISKKDWASYETAWDFTDFPLIHIRNELHCSKLVNAYKKICNDNQQFILDMHQLEEENNHIFIDAYNLQDELTPDVPLEEITLTCNPYYRYGIPVDENAKLNEQGFPINPELEARLLADTMKEFISYAVGCMFGRYSLDKPGLILANAGETLKDYLKQVPKPTFMPDEDNVIPILDGDWFTDDVTERFKEFLKVTFGEENYDENLTFIEEAIGKSIRSYFVKDFYNDHVKMYKKRPIYWLFSSPKGSFNVLIYLHRYRPDTVSIVLNDYLREFRTKLTARKSHLEHTVTSADTSQKDKTIALKEIEKIKKILDEVEEYETEILYPFAMEKVELDLDDGVKVNYAKLGKALKSIKGME